MYSQDSDKYVLRSFKAPKTFPHVRPLLQKIVLAGRKICGCTAICAVCTEGQGTTRRTTVYETVDETQTVRDAHHPLTENCILDDNVTESLYFSKINVCNCVVYRTL